MATIKPTLGIVSNASGASTPGPLSVALNLSVTKDITVVGVKSENLTVSDSAASFLTDALDQGAITAGDTAGTHGCFLYIKNTSPADHDVSFGFVASATDPTAAEVYGGGALGTRLGTLKQGEFMFMPYDYAGDLTIDAENAAATIEYMIFSRT
jgi:hypothetical protein